MGNIFSTKTKKKFFFKKTKNGNYIVKVDELQIDRLQQLHHVLKICCNANFYSPISQDLTRGIDVLDVGSGTGTWVFDVSSDFPKSRFTGVEIQSFMLPTIRPSNTNFIHNDILEGIPFNPNSFDYIHMRYMILCFTDLQYDKVIKNLVELLRPNGYLELCEPNMNFTNMGPATQRLVDEISKLLSARSMNPSISDRLHEYLEKNGLQEIRQHDVMLPLSELDGEIGSLLGQNFVNIINGLKRLLIKQMNITHSEINQLINEFITEAKLNRMYCRYTMVHVVLLNERKFFMVYLSDYEFRKSKIPKIFNIPEIHCFDGQVHFQTTDSPLFRPFFSGPDFEIPESFLFYFVSTSNFPVLFIIISYKKLFSNEVIIIIIFLQYDIHQLLI
ncbi:class I SAM-dependent methyltransferase [Rhizophagus clarus]|uniref:Class I SAM-dependent methyltransferase n=1 Tax=Rhizophagus clarus TaxID=94130 RepID=A0A8H3L8I5_9GLOM|nr:class I SAM-dependent methyltransferase [Rhizophagus clarus]